MIERRMYFKEWRIYAGLTQDELGARMEITGAQVSRIENGKRDFTGDYLWRFAEALSIPECKYWHVPIASPPDPTGILHNHQMAELVERATQDLRDRIKDIFDAQGVKLPERTG